MAICNLFNELINPSGNFMLFSQYVEDIMHNFTEGDNYKVIPSKFVAMNIDYSKIDGKFVLNDGNEFDLNRGIPKFFQNYFENACAYGRTHYKEITDGNSEWTPDISKNLFWNTMFDGNFISSKLYGSDKSKVKSVPEIMYYGDINMHSYNEHQGMGYGEIYCYIPTKSSQVVCQVVSVTDNEHSRVFVTNTSDKLEGRSIEIENYSKNYFYNKDFNISFDDEELSDLAPSINNKYNINTIVVLYSIYRKINDNWISLYSNIPMGMYITGRFEYPESDVITNGEIITNLTNTITKYVSTSYDTGTSYGLRICTRFSANPNGNIISNTETVSDGSSYTNLCQLMTSMNENLSKMMEVSKASVNNLNHLKEIYSILKNNRTNVPYIKNVNGTDCWFVNGKFVATVSQGSDKSCVEIPVESIEQRIANLKDLNPNNDYEKVIYDENECEEFSPRELAENLGLELKDEQGDDKYPESGFVTEIVKDCDCGHDVATEEEINKELELVFDSKFILGDCPFEDCPLEDDLENDL